jgi:hypothetical protein
MNPDTLRLGRDSWARSTGAKLRRLGKSSLPPMAWLMSKPGFA